MLMVAGNFLAGVTATPDWLRHAPDIGFTVADAVAPAFVVVMGQTVGASFARRRRDSALRELGAIRHFVMRAFALIGIGAVISAGSVTIAGEPSGWGVLQALGVATLLCLSVIGLPTAARAGVGVALLVAYQVLVDTVALNTVLMSNHGGLVGTLGWGALLIIATAVADLRGRGMRAFTLTCGVLVLIAALAMLLVPVSKNRVSASYVLLTLALAALALLVTDTITRAGPSGEGLLCWWGRNAIGLYLMHLALLGVFMIPVLEPWYRGAPFAGAVIQLLVVLGVLSLAAAALHRRRWYWRL